MSAYVKDWCRTVKSCAGLVLIGALASFAMMLIRLVGENRLQRYLDRLLSFRRNPHKDDLTPEHMMPENRT
jgi:hypothetical protein